MREFRIENFFLLLLNLYCDCFSIRYCNTDNSVQSSFCSVNLIDFYSDPLAQFMWNSYKEIIICSIVFVLRGFYLPNWKNNVEKKWRKNHFPSKKPEIRPVCFFVQILKFEVLLINFRGIKISL